MADFSAKGAVFGLDQFLGYAYVHGLPNSVEALIAASQSPQTCSYPPEFYACIGEHSITLPRNLRVEAGVSFSASSSDGAYFYGRILEYSPETGSSRILVENLDSPLRGKDWSFSFCMVDRFYTLANSLANYLTGATTLDSAANILRFHNPAGPWKLFDDFGYSTMFSESSDPLPSGLVYSGSGTSSLTVYNGSATCMVSAVTSRSSLSYGFRGFFCIGATQGKMYYETRVEVPAALSSAGSVYTLSVGLKGEGSTDTDPFSVGGIGFTYTHSQNSGRWVGRVANNSTTGTVNSTVAVTSSGVFTLGIKVESATVTFYVNGVSIGTSVVVPTAHANNLMRPFHSIVSGSPFSSYSALYSDYLYLEVYGD